MKKNILDFLYRRSDLLEAAGLLLLFVAVAYSFSERGTSWFWKDYPYMTLVAISLLLFGLIIWLHFERSNVKKKIEEISKKNQKQKTKKVILQSLSPEQNQMFEKIIQGLSHKEIASRLSMDFSKLKITVDELCFKLDIKKQI